MGSILPALFIATNFFGVRIMIARTSRTSRRSSALMQSLEPRMLLSGTQSFNNGILTITFDDGNNAVDMGFRDAGGTNFGAVIDNGSIINYAQTGGSAQVITGIHVHMGNGNSAVFMVNNFSGATDKTFDIPTTIAGGSGGDFVQDQGSDALLFFGGSGNDTIQAGSGNDTIFSGSGADNISTGSGNSLIFGDGPHGGPSGDTIVVGDGNDTIFALGGNDSITCGDGTDVIYASSGDTIIGGAGRDKVYVLRGTPLTVSGPSVPVKAISNKASDAIFLKHRKRAIHDVVFEENLGPGF